MGRLRIEGGIWRGKWLEFVEIPSIRPSSSKTKLAIFNALESQRLKLGQSREFLGCRCLELFAGSGALGFEALSRGAESLVLVEKDRRQAKSIEKNFEILNCSDRAKVYCLDVKKFLDTRSTEKFDLIFLDPPYDDGDVLAHLIKIAELGNSGAWLILEHNPKVSAEALPGWEINSTRVLGPAGITIYHKLS